MFKLFLSISLLSTIMLGLSAKSIFTLWMALEINMIVFIGMMTLFKSKFSPTTVMYFLPQAIASAIFLTSSLFIFMSNMEMIWKLLFSMALALKVGLAPFHMWFIHLANLVSKEIFFFLSALQKVLPLFMIINFKPFFIVTFIIISIIISVMSSIAQPKMMKLLAFSSIFTSCWLASALTMNTVVLYLFVYSIPLAAILIMLNSLVVKSVDAVSNFTLEKIICFFYALFLMMGLPPFISFMIKIFIMQSLMSEHNFSLTFFLIGGTAGFFYIYLLMMFSLMEKETKTNLLLSMNSNSLVLFLALSSFTPIFLLL